MADVFELVASSPHAVERTRRSGLKVSHHATMLLLHGVGPEGETCKHCIHLRRHVYSKTYLKCSQSGVTNGPATDWRAKWRACGLFQREEER